MLGFLKGAVRGREMLGDLASALVLLLCSMSMGSLAFLLATYKFEGF